MSTTLTQENIMLETLPDPFEVFQALTGFEPRPWQRRLLKKWIEDGTSAWSTPCGVPTGLGKSMLPIMAIIASAYVEAPPRRIVYVVNRRIVVDQTYEIAKQAVDKIHHQIEDDSILGRFKTIYLNKMGLDGDLVSEERVMAPAVHLLRGGTNEKLLRSESPILPIIIVSTVDQAGSRLLLRGYGMRKQAWPIQGGLLAYDTFWIIDEAHTAKPLLATLKLIHIRLSKDENKPGRLVGKPFFVMPVSATLDKKNEAFVPEGQEIKIADAIKNVTVEWVEENGKDYLAKRADKFVQDVLEKEDTLKVAVVCNTINAARSVFSEVKKSLKNHPRNPDVILLIGAIRPHDRKRLYENESVKSLAAGKRPERPVIAISTQTLETGPDYDFDALMTEFAALDALIQRMGRLNRRGETKDPQGLIWGNPSKPSVVYGNATIATDHILKSWHDMPMRFSPIEINQVLDSLDEDLVNQAWTPSNLPEILAGARMRDLGRTWPANDRETDVAWYLHGENAGDVSIVWRNNIESLLEKNTDERRKNYLELYPPRSQETLTISSRAARAFLSNNSGEECSDAADSDGPRAKEVSKDRSALAVRGEEMILVDSRKIQAGDTIFVPTTYGWYDQYGYAPGLRTIDDAIKEEIPFNDVAVCEKSHLPEQEEDETLMAWKRRVIKFFIEMLRKSEDEREQKIAQKAKNAAKTILEEHPIEKNKLTLRVLTSTSCSQHDDSASGEPIKLCDHNHRVGERAYYYAKALGLDEEICLTLKRAGELHDLGKVDPDFQKVRLGNLNLDIILAKSVAGTVDGNISYRHECGSLSMIKEEPAIIRHLVGTHHGYGRPGFPDQKSPRKAVTYEQDGHCWTYDGNPIEDRLGSWWRKQFADLSEQHNPWGLAYLEAILRLGDARTSAEERKSSIKENL